MKIPVPTEPQTMLYASGQQVAAQAIHGATQQSATTIVTPQLSAIQRSFPPFDSPIAPLIWPTVPCLPRLADYQIW